MITQNWIKLNGNIQIQVHKYEFVKVGDIITPNIQVYPVTYPFDLNDVELSIVMEWT